MYVDLILLYAVILLVCMDYLAMQVFLYVYTNVCFHIGVFATCRRARKDDTQKKHLELVTSLALSQAICINH